MRNAASILIVDYGESAWTQYGTTEQFHMFHWGNYQTLEDTIGSNGPDTLSKMGITDGKRPHQASTNEMETIVAIAEAMFHNDRKYVGTQGTIHLFKVERNEIQAI